MTEDTLVYRIDGADIIVSVSDNWHVFADDNAWAGDVRSESVVGHRLWDFIQDLETRHLYQEVFHRVRAGKSCQPIPFRCDSPSERRFLEITFKAISDGQINITSRIIRTERRSPLRLLEIDTPRSSDLLTICSMCKKIKVLPEQWEEIEDALIHLRLFEADEMPMLTHGICPGCFQVAMAELDEFDTPNKAIDDDEE